MVFEARYKSKYVIVDTSAFIRNANLQDIGETIITVPEVVNEIKSKRQLRRLVVLPYDLQIKEAFPENIKHVTEFSKKTGDYPSLSAADLKVIALTYQLEKEHIGTDHLKTVPQINRTVDYCNYSAITLDKIAGFYRPKKSRNSNDSESSALSEGDEVKNEKELSCSLEKCNISDNESEYLSACSDSSDLDEFVEIDEKIYESDGDNLQTTEVNKTDNAVQLEDYESFSSGDNDANDLINDIFVRIQTNKEIPNEHGKGDCSDNDNNNLDYDDDGEGEEESGDDDDGEGEEESGGDDDDDDADAGWITPSNVKQVKQEMDADNLEEKSVTVACLTMDFAMQNVLKQIGLNVLSLDGRVIKQMRTFILRCYACFKTTSIMTKVFCHHCGNKTLKRVAVSLDADGNEKIHINLRKPLTARGKKFSLPKPRGGKHPNYPILFEDQPLPDQRPTRLARTKNNPLDPDYIAGFSPFVMRDINSKSAMLGVQNKSKEVKYWMRRNPNESFGKKKKKK